MLTEEEENQLLVEFNDTQADYPRDKTIQALFEDQVQKNPDQVALVFEGQQLTYAELNQQANRVAHLLRQKGVKSEDRVALLTVRSLDMIVGMLGILKSGGAYLPIDPEYPMERIDFMLADSGAKAVLSQTSVIQQLGLKGHPDRPCLALDHLDTAQINETNPTNTTRADHLAYVIYTSGTTGTPKGV
ncbi:AMP-binding protein, partial [Jeotgalicoccus sp. S0W5]|uniref:AMP-binding protein n=1 Tax=Jeotgalicoccus sp. S0W5 TaxID=2527874 RepID=UPI001414F5A3